MDDRLTIIRVASLGDNLNPARLVTVHYCIKKDQKFHLVIYAANFFL